MDSASTRIDRAYGGGVATWPTSARVKAEGAPSQPISPDAVILVHDLRASGVVINAIRIAEAARQAGTTVELWVMNAHGQLAASLPPELRLRCLGRGSGLPRWLDSLLALPRLIVALRRHRPAILLSAGNHVHAFALFGARLARVRGTALVCRVSNALAATVGAKRPGLTGCLLRAMAIGWERIQFGAMDRLIAVSHELADDLVIYGGADRAAITVIPNGIDAAAVERKAGEPVAHPWFAESAPPVIVAIGRLGRQKNFEQAIRAFALLRRGRQARLVIIGHGSESERAKLLRLAAGLGIAHDVWLAGYQANPYRFLARSRLFVMTSRWEGSSNVLIEALACGLPVVATDCPTGVREILGDRPTARIVPVGAVEATFEAMSALLDLRHHGKLSSIVASEFRLSDSLARYATAMRAVAPPREAARSI